jgi:transposase
VIFVWFAIEGRSKSWIARQLTRLNVPKDHRATVAQWSSQNVDAVLRNEKYVGKWPWGRTKRARNPITGKCKQESRPVEEISEDWLREYPHLRLIDDELFQKASARLEIAAAQFAEHRSPDGTLTGSSTLRPVAHALQNLIRCAKCDRPFIRAGQKKAYLRCSGSLRNQCDVRTALRRDLATTLIRDAAETRLLKNSAFLDAVFVSTLEQWRKSINDQPDALREAETQKVSIEQRIARIERQIENDDDPPPNLSRLLKERNNELQNVTRQIESLRKQSSAPLPEPTREWIADQIRDRFLEDLASGVPSHIEAFQELFAERIVVHECERLNRRRKYLRMSICFDSTQLSGLLMGSPEASASESVREVVEIDIRPKCRSDDQARLAHSMWAQGASCDEIAQALRVSRSRVTALFHHAAKELGLPKPDTRGRRPLSEVQKQIEPEVVARYEGGELLDEIAKAVGASRPTVDRCLARWLEQQGLPKVDGRTRRKTLLLRQRSSKPTPSLGSAEPPPSKSETESEERMRDECSPHECGGSAA